MTQFLTPLMLCELILFISGETYSLISTLNEKILSNNSLQFCFFLTKLFAILLTPVNTNTCSLDLYNADHQTTIFLFTHNAYSLHSRLTKLLLNASPCLLICAFYMHLSTIWWRFLKWNIRGLALSRILLRLPYCLCSAHYVRILVYPSWLLLLVYVFDGFVSVCLCRMCCVHIVSCCVINLFHSHDLCSYSFCLLFSCEMILGHFNLRNNIMELLLQSLK